MADLRIDCEQPDEESTSGPFSDFDADYMVSPDGGDELAWSPDGKELYFQRGYAKRPAAENAAFVGVVALSNG